MADALTDLRSRSSGLKSPRAQVLWLAGVLVVGACLSLTLWGILRHREYQLARTTFQLNAQKRAEAIQHALADRVVSCVRFGKAFFDGSHNVERGEFRTFAKPMLQDYTALRSLGWAAEVPAAERPAHEQAFLLEFDGYRIIDDWAQPESRRGGVRQVSWPLVYCMPDDAKQSPIGYDLADRPDLRDLLGRAIAAPRAVALIGPRPPWVSEPDRVLFVASATEPDDGEKPSAPPKPAGVLLGVFGLGEAVENSLAYLERVGIDTYVFVGPSGECPVLAYSHYSRLRKLATQEHPELPTELSDLQMVAEFTLGDQRLTVYCRAIESFLASQRTLAPEGALVAGIVISLLIAGQLLVVMRRATYAENVAAQRTRELQAISDAALDAVVMMDADGCVAHWNPAAERMFGYTREEMLGKSVHGRLVPARFREQAERALAEFMRHGEGKAVGRVLELTALRREGSEFPIEISVAAIRFRDQWWAVGIVRDITKRKQAEDALLGERRLLRQLLNLHERDRRLVAFELHDGLAQQLTALRMRLDSYTRAAAANDPNAEHLLSDVADLLNRAVGETRRMIGGLRPAVLDEEGLQAAVESLVADHLRRGGPPIDVVVTLPPERAAAPLENAAYRIVQEALTNAVRYSRSPRIRIELGRTNDHLQIVVQDWGIGFDPQKVPANHYGLIGIRERANVLGGVAHVGSAPESGTRIEVELPWMPPEPPEDDPESELSRPRPFDSGKEVAPMTVEKKPAVTIDPI